MSLPPASHRQALREATAQVHAQLDARFASGLEAPGAWARYVLGMHAFAHGLVAALQRAGIAPSPQLQAACAALQRDVRTGGWAPPAPAALQLATTDEALGACYVFEGSTLGAAVLRRSAPASEFLAAHAGDASRWRAFVGQLEARPLQARDGLLAGAHVAFAAAADAFK